MLFNDGASEIAHRGVTSTAVIFTLRIRIPRFGPTERTPVLHQEIFLLESDPETGVVRNGGSCIRGVCLAAREHHLTHYEKAVKPGGVRVESDWLQDTVGITTVSLQSRAAVKSPLGAVSEGQILRVAFEDFGFAAQICNGLVTVKPEVFKFQFSHVN